jgi:acetyl esterase/lipase
VQRAKPIPTFAYWQIFETPKGSTRVLVHQPRQPKGRGKIILYFHGGDFIVGSPVTHADITGALCVSTGCPVYSIDYRLAPEHLAPAAIEDGMAVLAELAENDDRSRFVIAGDCAGGAIALAVEAATSDALKKRVAGVCSFYGLFGHFDPESHHRRGRRDDGTDLACRKRFWTLAHGDPKNSPFTVKALDRASPVPVYLMSGDGDPLCDDKLILAQTLEKRGRAVTVDLAAGERHGFLHNGPTDTAAARAIDWAVGWISDL